MLAGAEFFPASMLIRVEFSQNTQNSRAKKEKPLNQPNYLLVELNRNEYYTTIISCRIFCELTSFH